MQGQAATVTDKGRRIDIDSNRGIDRGIGRGSNSVIDRGRITDRGSGRVEGRGIEIDSNRDIDRGMNRGSSIDRDSNIHRGRAGK